MIRKATLFDLNTLWELWLALISEESAKELTAGREQYPKITLADKDAWAVDMSIQLTSPYACVLLAEKGGQAVGFMLSSAQGRTLGSPSRYLHVHQLYVRPSERKHSGGDVANQLCAETEKWAREQALAYVECDAVPSNESLWVGRGFKVVAVRLAKEI